MSGVSKPLYRVGELARIAGVTVRTLHHYDRIGLLRPTGRSGSGYRLYGTQDLLRLQQIHIGRSLGLSLEEIRRTLDDPDFDRRGALVAQREKLVARLDETHAMIASVDAALQVLDTEATAMEPKDLFDGFDPKVVEAEAKARWGDTPAHKEASRRTSQYTPEDWARIKTAEETILSDFAAARAAGKEPADEMAMDLAERHRLHIDRWFYPCSTAQHGALAEMYLADPRFTAYFEKHGEGMAAYVVAAIQANASRE